jgi:hypothetical protein
LLSAHACFLWGASSGTPCIKGDSKISLKKKPVIGDDKKKSLTKKFSYKSFFVFEIQMIENLVKIASTYVAELKVIT